ncbi:unnamed protein product [Musa acuminata subsp. malaccensis]|uniref:(wild Malaysian banana) hypothetical protein n=1 Tax=Musa acuminata subsp. malaccensis TaxID=214687 RepID=A0A804KKF8_MUSAM|nr:unnamed protein product [Musa acuminata subsp. malaccensis]
MGKKFTLLVFWLCHVTSLWNPSFYISLHFLQYWICSQQTFFQKVADLALPPALCA